MARYVLPVVGAVVGSYFGNPQLGFAIGSMLGSIVDPQVIKGPSIGDGQTTTTQEGQARPIIWGSGVVGANIIDRGELVRKKKRTRQGKGGPVVENEHVYLTYALRICEGPIKGVLRVWEDEKLVYDVRTDGSSQVSSEDNASYAKNFRLYLGDENQMPDSALEAIHGVGNTPAYRGTAYMVFESRDVTDRRGSIPTYRFEVVAGGGDIVTQGRYIFANVSAQETDDSFDFTENSTHLALGSVNQRSLLTRDQRFILSGSGSNSSGRVYELNSTTGDYDEIGTFSEVIQNWDQMSWNGVAYTMDQDEDGDTIVMHLSNGTAFGTFRLYVVKYDRSSGTFTMTASESVPNTLMGSSPIACDPFGHWCVVSSRSPTGMHRYFITEAGTVFDQSFISLSPLNNWPTHLLVAHGPTAPSAYTVIACRDSDWIAHCFIGPTSSSTPSITTRSLATDFPGVNFSNNNRVAPYYVESEAGWPKVVLMGSTGDAGDPDRSWALCSYEIRGSIPTPPFQSLFPVVELTGQPGDGHIHVASGGYGVDITAVSGRNDSGPVDSPGMIRFYKFSRDQYVDQFTMDAMGSISDDSNLDQYHYLQSPSSRTSGSSGDGISYRWFIEDVCLRSGLPLSKVEASEMTDYTIRGVVAASPYNGREVIRSTQPVFPIDIADYDKKLHFTKRGKPAVAAITIDEMLDETYKFTRKDAQSYPRKLNLIYQHQRTGYVAAKATVERLTPDVRVSGENSTTVPVVMDEHQATRAADILLKVSWTDEEGDIEFSIPSSFDYLTVGDCVAIYPRSGQQYRLRIESISRADGRMDVRGKIDRQTSYGSTVTALPVPDPTPPPPTTTGPTRLAYLDIPALTDADDMLCYYLAVNGESPAWYGAVTERRIGSDEFGEVASSNGQAVGVLLEDLGPGPVDYTDTFNAVEVRIAGGESNAPQSVSDEQLLREQNVLAVCRSDGSAELLQFRDVEDMGDDRYRLTHLIRGRMYTGATSHAQGATVVLLDYGASRVQVDAALLNATWDHRAVSYGQDSDLAAIRTDTYAARSQVEFPPALVSASVVGSDMTVSWSHAFRFGSDVTPVDSINRTGYRVSATDGVNSYTIDVSPGTETVSFDVSGWSGTATVTVQGLNRYTGPGMPSTVNVEL